MNNNYEEIELHWQAHAFAFTHTHTHTHTHTLTTHAVSKAGFEQREGGFATRDLHARPVLVSVVVESIEVDTHTAAGDSHGHSVLIAVLSEFHAERGVLQSFLLRDERSPWLWVFEVLDQKERHSAGEQRMSIVSECVREWGNEWVSWLASLIFWISVTAHQLHVDSQDIITHSQFYGRRFHTKPCIQPLRSQFMREIHTLSHIHNSM